MWPEDGAALGVTIRTGSLPRGLLPWSGAMLGWGRSLSRAAPLMPALPALSPRCPQAGLRGPILGTHLHYGVFPRVAFCPASPSLHLLCVLPAVSFRDALPLSAHTCLSPTVWQGLCLHPRPVTGIGQTFSKLMSKVDHSWSSATSECKPTPPCSWAASW